MDEIFFRGTEPDNILRAVVEANRAILFDDEDGRLDKNELLHYGFSIEKNGKFVRSRMVPVPYKDNFYFLKRSGVGSTHTYEIVGKQTLNYILAGKRMREVKETSSFIKIIAKKLMIS